MNQQMATFILWQTMFQQASYEWQNAYYQQYFGGTKSEILTQYQSPEQYGITMAAYYTKEALNSGLYSIKDYLIELVAGADAAYEAGLKFDENDKKDVQDVVSWMQNIYVNLGFNYSGVPFKNFLAEYVGDSFKTSDIEAAAKIMVTEIPGLTAGLTPEWKSSDSRNICPSVMEITLVGIYAETSPA